MNFDPILKYKKHKVTPQKFRSIQCGPESMLINGQMVQAQISDPFNDKKFHPTDKIILLKHEDHYLAMGSYCGYDYKDLSNGVLLGEKLVCSCCGSEYNIHSGMPEQGPNLRTLTQFPCRERKGMIEVVVPEHIPPFQKRPFVRREVIDPRCYVILGDTETALSAITALRSHFTGRIVMVPFSRYGTFENVDLLKRQFSPLA